VRSAYEYSCGKRRKVQPVRLDIGQYRVRYQEANRASLRQPFAQLGGGNLQRGLPDEGDLPAGTAQGLRIADAARRQQVAQRLGRFHVGVRALQHQQVAMQQQLLPAMPAGQAAEGIPAEHQEQLIVGIQFGAQGFQDADAFDHQPRTCPSPNTTYFSLVRPSRPTGPRACSLSVEMPISAPRPYSKPSAKRVEALTITELESTSVRKRRASVKFSVMM